jgi:hypothetical protein
VVELLELVVQVADPAAAGDRFVDHRSTGHLLDVLPEVADRQLLRYRHFPLVGSFLTDDHAEEGGLPGAIRADEPGLLARIELEGRVDEEHLASVLFADAGKGDHGDTTSLARRRGPAPAGAASEAPDDAGPDGA